MQREEDINNNNFNQLENNKINLSSHNIFKLLIYFFYFYYDPFTDEYIVQVTGTGSNKNQANSGH